MDITLLLPLVLLAVLLIFMWRSNKKRSQQQQDLRRQLVPGTEVLTQAGIYGTIIEVDSDKNVAVLETSPGVLLRVHSATIINVITPAVPDDASELADEAATAPDHEERSEAGQITGDEGSQHGTEDAPGDGDPGQSGPDGNPLGGYRGDTKA